MTTVQHDVLTPSSVALPVQVTPWVVSVRPVGAERRTPVVIVHVMVGPLVLVLDVVRLQRKLQVRSPVADGGGPAVAVKPEVWEPIEQAVLAAAQADSAARGICSALGSGWLGTDRSPRVGRRGLVSVSTSAHSWPQNRAASVS